MPLNTILTFVWKQQDNKHTACISIKEQVSIDLSIGNKFLNLTLPLVLKKNGITVLQCRMGHWWWNCGMELLCWDVQGATGMPRVLPHISPLLYSSLLPLWTKQAQVKWCFPAFCGFSWKTLPIHYDFSFPLLSVIANWGTHTSFNKNLSSPKYLVQFTPSFARDLRTAVESQFFEWSSTQDHCTAKWILFFPRSLAPEGCWPHLVHPHVYTSGIFTSVPQHGTAPNRPVP